MISPKRIYKMEVGETKSSSLQWFIRLARKQRAYRVEKKYRMVTHISETANLDTAMSLWQHISNLKNTAFYIDGQLVPRAKSNQLLWNYHWQPRSVKNMLNEIIKKKQRERDEGNWRMGLGSDPGLD